MKELKTTQYNSDTYTDVNMLYKNDLIDTPTLSMALTHLYGKDSEMFPLLSLTEGQGGIVSLPKKEMNDTTYTWNVIGRMKNTSRVVALANTSNTKPGLGGTPFEVIFEDDWFPKYYTITSPDKQHEIRINSTGRSVGANQFQYSVTLNSGDATSYISLDNFQNGLAWVMGAPKIAASKSDGTRSNSMSPGKWTNQFGFFRFSKPITGNVSNKVTNIEFDLEGGGKTNMWMPWEMKQWEIQRRQALEEDLWNSKYNKDAYGRILLKDPETGEDIPTGAGIKEILKTTGQHDTYGTLTLAKLDNMINKIFSNRVDDTPMEVVLFGGSGALRSINNAIKNDARGNSYYEKLGSEEIMSGKDGYLSYGRYFNQYKTIDGHIITFKRANIFDHGKYAEMDRANGAMTNGFPNESYNMVLLDMSTTSDGDRNIQLVGEKGREVITGIYKGMTPLPASWGAAESKLLSSKKDEASYEVITSQGITMKNYTTSYFLEYSA